MSKTSVRLISVVAAAALLLGGFYYYRNYLIAPPSGPGSEKTAETTVEVAAEGPPPTPAEAVILQPEYLSEVISVNGSTIANKEVMVSSEVAGKIKQILFTEGRRVAKGNPLVILDTDELVAQRQRLEVRKRLTATVAQRLKALYEQEGVSLQDYETAQAEADQVVAELDLLDVQIKKRTVRAPFTGRLGLKLVNEGSYISPGQSIVSLVSLDPIHLELAVPEKYNSALQIGSEIVFEMDGMDQPVPAKIIAREPSIDPATRTLPLKASARNPQERILPGAFAKVTVQLGESESSLMVPTEAIIPELGGKKVFRYKNGLAEAVSVETGIRKNKNIQVVSGLSTGDTILTTGVLQIQAGMPVTITNLNQPIGKK